MNEDTNNDRNKSVATKIDQIKQLCRENGVALTILDQLEELADMVADRPIGNQHEISAQLSIYPLRQPSLSQTINEALEVLRNYGLRLIPGSMSTLIIGKEAILWAALQEDFSVAATHGEVVMIISISNACPKPNCVDR